MNIKRLILIACIVLFVIGMIFYSDIIGVFSKDKNHTTETMSGKNTPLNVAAQIIEPDNLIDIFPSMGNLMPDEEVDLSFEASGKITTIYFKEGTVITKGTLLAKVNDSPLQAELKKLETQIPLAEDRVYRQKTLLEKDAVSKEAFEQVTTELDKLKADIELTKSRIAQTELRAPFDGLIGLRMVSEGTYASPTTIIAKLTKIVPLKVEFSINEKHINQITQGTRIEFAIPNDLNTYSATIYAIESKIDLKTRTLKARAIYPNADGKLKPGAFVAISVKLNEIKNALTVPAQAIIAEMGRDIAYVYQNGKAKQVVLTKGIRTESKVQIIDGINTGDTLIVTGIMQLRDGLPVRIETILK